MKKVLSVVFACLMALTVFAACASDAPSTSTPESSSVVSETSTPAGSVGSTADYAAVVEAVKNPERVYPIVTNAEEDEKTMCIDFMGLTPDNMQRYAICTSRDPGIAYSVTIILPAEGKMQDVKDDLQGFVDMQKKAFDGYRMEQYAIAEASVIKEAESGEVVLVMAEDADAVMEEIMSQLKAG